MLVLYILVAKLRIKTELAKLFADNFKSNVYEKIEASRVAHLYYK